MTFKWLQKCRSAKPSQVHRKRRRRTAARRYLPLRFEPLEERALLAVSFTQITNTTGPHDLGAPSMSADGTRIAFLSNSGVAGANQEVCLLDTTTNTLTQITTTPSDRQNTQLSLSADGRHMVFMSNANLAGRAGFSGSQVFLYDIDHAPTVSGFTQITSGLVFALEPAINGDGSRIVFAANDGNNPEIFLAQINHNGEAPTFTVAPITSSDTANNFDPAISADGNSVVYVSNIDGDYEIWLWKAATGNSPGTHTQITKTTEPTVGIQNSSPTINADGTRIAFFSTFMVGGGYIGPSIFLHEVTPVPKTTRITNGDPGSYWPQINADGTSIVFYSSSNLTGTNGDFNAEIFVYDASAGIKQVTFTEGADSNKPTINGIGDLIAFLSPQNLTPAAAIKNNDFNLEVFAAIVNHPPVAVNDSYITAEGSTLNVTAPGVLGNDTDVDDNPLTTRLVDGPSHGTLTFAANGSFSYTHDGSETTSDEFTYVADDGPHDSNVATVTFSVTPVNDAPAADNDDYNVPEGSIITIGAPNGVLNGDTDAEGDSLSAVLVLGPTHGLMTFNADGSFTYVHDGSELSDSFTYLANDGTADSNLATVTISVIPINDAPVADDDFYLIPSAGATLTIDTPGVLAGDTDAEGDSLIAALINPPSHSVLTLNLDGSFTYVHDGSASDDFFTYKAEDGRLASNLAIVTISIFQPNLPPVADDDAFTVPASGTLTIPDPGVMDGDYDPEGLLLRADLVSGPAHGTLTLGAWGGFTYVHDGGPTASDTFSYRVSDGALESNLATVTLSIAPPLADLSIGASFFSAHTPPWEGETDALLWITVANLGPDLAKRVMASIALPAGLVVTHIEADQGDYDPQTGIWTLGELALLDANDYAADLYLTVDVAQGTGGQTFATQVAVTAPIGIDPDLGNNEATVSIMPVNFAPVAVPDFYQLLQGGALTIAAPGALGNDTDANGNALTATLVSGPAHGDLTLNPDGSFTYVHDGSEVSPFFPSTDTFIYKASDGRLSSNLATVTLNIAAPPQANLGVIFDTPELNVEQGSTTGAITLTVFNLGFATAQDIQVRIDAPPGLEIVSISMYGEPVQLTSNRFVVPGLQAPSGFSGSFREFDFVLNVAPGTAGQDFNFGAVIVSANPALDPDPGNNQDSVVIHSTLPMTDLSIGASITGESVVIKEAETGVLLWVTVTNFGPNPAHLVSAHVELPAGLTITNIEGDGSFDPQTGIWTIGDLETVAASDQSADLYLTIDVAAGIGGQSLEIRAETSAEQVPDRDDTNNSTVLPLVPIAWRTDLWVHAAFLPNIPYWEGETQPFRVILGNRGPLAARNVHIAFDPPPGVEVTRNSDYDPVTRSFVFPLIEPTGDHPWQVSFSVTPLRGTGGQALPINVRVWADEWDPDLSDNTTTSVLNVTAPQADLYVEASHMWGRPLKEGVEQPIQLRIGNLGPQQARNVRIAVSTPPFMNFRVTSYDQSYDPETGYITLPFLDTTFPLQDFIYVTPLEGTDGRTISIGFTILADDPRLDPNPNNNHDSVSLALININDPPFAFSGSLYIIDEGDSLTLNASGSFDPDGDPLTYEWDVNGDGRFGEAVGVKPTLTPAQLVALRLLPDGFFSTSTIRVRVNDGEGHTVESAAATLWILNKPPVATGLAVESGVDSSGRAVRGFPVTFSVSAIDASSFDTFQYEFDWDGNGTWDEQTAAGYGGSILMSHVYDTPGAFTPQVRVRDDDGGVSETRVLASRLSIQTLGVIDGQLVVSGTPGADTVQIATASGGRIRVEIGTQVHFFNQGEVRRIELRLGDGDDEASVANSITVPTRIYGGDGNDRLRGADVMDGGAGDDDIREGKGSATISGGPGRDTIHAGANGDTLNGGDGDDVIFGGQGSDMIAGGNGNDVIQAGQGDDIVDGGAGDDDINSGGGDDILVGSAGDDLMVGGDGRDLLIGGCGADRLIGKGDDDLLIAGTTIYDRNIAALNGVLSLWKGPGNYNARQARVRDAYFNTLGSALDDGVRDILTGDAGQDWFLANLVLDAGDNSLVLDTIADLQAKEFATDLDFILI